MHNPEKFIGAYQTIEYEVEVFEDFVFNYRNLLNNESIWLFLATLGCWGVSHHAIQMLAFSILAYLFVERLSIYKNNSKSFKEYLLIIERRVPVLVSDNKTRDDWFNYINNLKVNNISTIRPVRRYEFLRIVTN